MASNNEEYKKLKAFYISVYCLLSCTPICSCTQSLSSQGIVPVVENLKVINMNVDDPINGPKHTIYSTLSVVLKILNNFQYALPIDFEFLHVKVLAKALVIISSCTLTQMAFILFLEKITFLNLGQTLDRLSLNSHEFC